MKGIVSSQFNFLSSSLSSEKIPQLDEYIQYPEGWSVTNEGEVFSKTVVELAKHLYFEVRQLGVHSFRFFPGYSGQIVIVGNFKNLIFDITVNKNLLFDLVVENENDEVVVEQENVELKRLNQVLRRQIQGCANSLGYLNQSIMTSIQSASTAWRSSPRLETNVSPYFWSHAQ